MFGRKIRRILGVGALLAATPVVAQSTDVDARIDRLERQLRAVQRTVFPNGEPVQPQTGPAAATPVGTPAASPLADVNARLDAMEKSLASLTGQIEQQGNRLRLVEEASRARDAAAPTPSAAAPGTADTTSAPASATSGNTAASEPAAMVSPAASEAAQRTEDARKAAVAAIEVPVTGDAGEDLYTYGYRLYAAKLYPEAQAVLKSFATKYPKHRRASFAQNLLGRAYLDEGKPGLAVNALFANYQTNPRGERAAESLTWLGQALLQLNQADKACQVYAELDQVYGARLTPELKARATKGRADARCAA